MTENLLRYLVTGTSIIVCGLPAGVIAAPPAPPEGFRWERNPTFSDEFNGSTLDTGKWHDHHPYWRGRPPAKFVPEAISVRKGMLRIQNRMLAKPDGAFTIGGGAVVSKSKQAFHGYGAWWVDANTIHFYCNDKHVGTVHPVTTHSKTPFDQPMHINMVRAAAPPARPRDAPRAVSSSRHDLASRR